MTRVAVASTDLLHADAGHALARDVLAQLAGEQPDLILLFASSRNEYEPLLAAVAGACPGASIAGCSSAGEFTSDGSGTGRTSVIALAAPQMQFRAVMARGLGADRASAARSLATGFAGLHESAFLHRAAIVFVDALAGHAEDLVDRLTHATAGMYRFLGGGAGDDGEFTKTHVFCGVEAATDAVVAVEILSNRPLGIGARHGWTPAGGALRVTEAANACVVSLNAAPAGDVFADHAAETGQTFDRENPLPFFLHNIVGVKEEGGHKLRVPLGVDGGGVVSFAAEVPTGSMTQIMSTGAPEAAAAAADATRDAMQQVREAGGTPRAALFLDCVATRLRLGQAFGQELDAVAAELDGIPFAGFNSYGQIVRADGQFGGFHNCTAVVLVIPD